MPTHSGHPYLLGESSESSITTMDPQQLADAIATIQAQLANLTQTAAQTGDRLGRVELVSRTAMNMKENVIGWYHIKDLVSETLIVSS